MTRAFLWLTVWFCVPLHDAITDRSRISNSETLTLAGYPKVPQCQYESCYSKHQCDSGTAAKYENFTERTESVFLCRCDKLCILFGDCCNDFFETCLETNISDFVNNPANVVSSLSTSLDKARVLAYQEILKYKVCVEIENGSYWMITHCPNTDYVSEGDSRNCEKKSQTLIGSVPVSLNEHPFISFANFHCALCHGLSRHQVYFWNTSASCSVNNTSDYSFQDLEKFVMNGTCNLNIGGDGLQRACNSNQNWTSSVVNSDSRLSQTKVNINGQEEDFRNAAAKLCPFYIYPVKDKHSKQYINPHCQYTIMGSSAFHSSLSCIFKKYKYAVPTAVPVVNVLSLAIPYTFTTAHVEIVGHISGQSVNLINPIRQMQLHTVNTHGAGTLNVLFRFRDSYLELEVQDHVLRPERKICPEDEVAVPYTNKCVKLKCDELDKKPVNGTCIPNEDLVMNGTTQLYPEGSNIYTVSLFIETETGRSLNADTVRFTDIILKELDTNWNSSVYHNCSLEGGKTTTANNGHSVTDSQLLSSFWCEFNIHSQSAVNVIFSVKRVMSKMKRHLRITNAVIDNFHNLSSSDKIIIEKCLENARTQKGFSCPSNSIPELHYNVTTELIEDVFYVTLYGVFFSLSNVPFEMDLNRNNFFSSCDVIVCVPDHDNDTLHCPHGKERLPITDFAMENNTLILQGSGFRYELGNYSLFNNGAVICNYFTRKKIRSQMTDQHFFNFIGTLSILNAITSCISIVCLIMTICVYAALPNLRNVPGKLVISLSGTLAIAQLLLLVVNLPKGPLCVLVTSLIHVTWISSFLWMNMLSLDLLYTFWKMSPSHTAKARSNVFRIYTIISLGIPIIIAATCFLLDHFHVTSIVIGYGTDSFCFITNHTAVLYFFGVPIALCLGINLVCFVSTLICIERTSSLISENSKGFRNGKNRLGIYVRLSLIMGLMWILSFVAGFQGITLLWYPQTILNGLQGFYICVCMVCKPRLIKKLKARYHMFNSLRGKDLSSSSVISLSSTPTSMTSTFQHSKTR